MVNRPRLDRGTERCGATHTGTGLGHGPFPDAAFLATRVVACALKVMIQPRALPQLLALGPLKLAEAVVASATMAAVDRHYFVPHAGGMPPQDGSHLNDLAVGGCGGVLGGWLAMPFAASANAVSCGVFFSKLHRITMVNVAGFRLRLMVGYGVYGMIRPQLDASGDNFVAQLGALTAARSIISSARTPKEALAIAGIEGCSVLVFRMISNARGWENSSRACGTTTNGGHDAH
ncbi:MAG: hypothetical protein ISQ13_02760 [Candidatus Margulisbacteria bacterium]|nr:hypothetical protein [Candidatus Margulisiibacteriota bacterium]